ncbi:spore germination protein [Paenibacillus sp. FSL R7-0331]|uniref:spore germination protein n=1 Tax=Paenibacillus sp. FSL R7-0331 TaxID=1536773 RepID=UPI0004F74F9A|nr:spore germination protein [Paenibacillus sp. FSL R7-0331]AIQ50516.1 spore gernimation protein KA [Paenibacillus sp. FSL R7-0331]
MNAGITANSEHSAQKIDSSRPMSCSMDDTLAWFRQVFCNDGTLRIRVIENDHGERIRCAVVYVDGMIDRELIQSGVMRPVMAYEFTDGDMGNPARLMELVRTRVITISDVTVSEQLDELIGAVVSGKTVFLLDGYAGSLTINAQSWETRSIEEPMTEKAVRGPRDGFNESLLTNLTLIRRRVQNSDLKFVFTDIGTRTKTQTCICYMESLASPDILKELQGRLARVEIDHLLDTGYLAELIRDEPYSPFEMIGSTERPDSVVGKIMEGRFAVLIEGSPFALTLPYVFVENFQASEDYYISYFFASFNRLLRVLGAFLSISIPAGYLALVTYSQEMVPTLLLLSIASARMSVPFPTVVEAVLMLTIFEILREAGARIPNSIGQAVSIVGALVLGQAAVDARIVSAPMVIVVGLTGITTLLNPRLTGPLIIVRMILLLSAFLFGIFGYFFGLLGLVIHLMSLRSFGVPYMLGVGSIRPQDIKDTAIRAPWWDMYLRPAVIGARNMKRKDSAKRGRR